MSLNPTPAEHERATELLDQLGQARHPAAVLAWALAEARALGERARPEPEPADETTGVEQ